MATLKCLACGHDNKVGDESCSSCSSSLNLKLCSVCEAINAHSAERCHGCKADFRVEPEVVTAPEVSTPGAEPHEAPPVQKSLPTAWRVAAQAARKRSTRITAALWLLPLFAAALGYYSYPALRTSEAVPAARAARQPEPAPGREAAPREITNLDAAKPQTPEVRQTQAPAVSGKLALPKSATAPLPKSTPVAEPTRMTTAVTHTRAAGAALPVAATAAPALNAAVPAPSAPATAMPESRRVAVTHTKAVLTEAAVPATAAASAAEGRSAPAETRSDEPAECPPAVAALGLCKTK